MMPLLNRDVTRSSGGHKEGVIRSEFLSGVTLNGGAEGIRTPDLIRARDALSQLSHGPIANYYMRIVVLVKVTGRG